jgi:hypothetical protein
MRDRSPVLAVWKRRLHALKLCNCAPKQFIIAGVFVLVTAGTAPGYGNGIVLSVRPGSRSRAKAW